MSFSVFLLLHQLLITIHLFLPELQQAKLVGFTEKEMDWCFVQLLALPSFTFLFAILIVENRYYL